MLDPQVAVLLLTGLLGLIGLLWLFSCHTSSFSSRSAASPSPPSTASETPDLVADATTTRPAKCPVTSIGASSSAGGRCPFSAANSANDPGVGPNENERPPGDPILEFAEGERKSAPFMCPFMAAFKSAQERNQRGDQEEEQQPAEDDPALQQLKEIMSGYEAFKQQKEMAAQERQLQQQQQDEADGDLDTNCSSLVGHMKRLEQEKLILQLTEEEMEAERRARETQLAEIYALMEAQQEKFGIGSVNEMQKQMRLYVT